MPFFKSRIADVKSKAAAQDAYSEAVVAFDASHYSRAALRTIDVVRYIRSGTASSADLIDRSEAPENALFFNAIDLIGRSLRTVWCLDEAEAVFCHGIWIALACPRAHGWAAQYFSRWVSTFDRRDMLKSFRANKFPAFDSKALRGQDASSGSWRPVFTPMSHPDQNRPPESEMKAIRAFIQELDPASSARVALFSELSKVAKEGTRMPDFERMSREVIAGARTPRVVLVPEVPEVPEAGNDTNKSVFALGQDGTITSSSRDELAKAAGEVFALLVSAKEDNRFYGALTLAKMSAHPLIWPLIADKVVPALVNAYSQERTERVKAAIVHALGELDDSEAHDALYRIYVEATEMNVIAASAVALGRRGDERVIRTLFTILMDTEPASGIYGAAHRAMERIGTGEAKALLELHRRAKHAR